MSCDTGYVSRARLICMIFDALDCTGCGRLTPDGWQRFSELARFPNASKNSWVRIYSEMSEKWQFKTCIDDADGEWYCPTALLWAILVELDKHDCLSGRLGHTVAALLRGQDRLQVRSEVELESEADDGDDEIESDSEAGAEGAAEDTEYTYDLLDTSPPPGTQVMVLHDDGARFFWYSARILKARGTKADIEYENGEQEEVDFDTDAIGCAEYMSDDESVETESECSDGNVETESEYSQSDDESDRVWSSSPKSEVDIVQVDMALSVDKDRKDSEAEEPKVKNLLPPRFHMRRCSNRRLSLASCGV